MRERPLAFGWRFTTDLLKQNSASLTRCACQSRLSLFFYFNFCCPGADIAMSKIGLFLNALGVLAAVTFTL